MVWLLLVCCLTSFPTISAVVIQARQSPAIDTKNTNFLCKFDLKGIPCMTGSIEYAMNDFTDPCGIQFWLMQQCMQQSFRLAEHRGARPHKVVRRSGRFWPVSSCLVRSDSARRN